MATKSPNVSLGFKRLEQDALLTFSNSVASKTIADSRFDSIKVLVDSELMPANLNFEKALDNAKGGGAAKTQAKNNAKKAVLDLLSKVAQEVNLIATGDAELILAAGFEVRGTSEKYTGDIAMVTEFVVEPTTTPGMVKCSWEKVPHATNYALEYVAADSEIWNNGNYSAGGKLTLKGLPSGEVRVRICALGSRNRKSAWKAVNVKVY